MKLTALNQGCVIPPAMVKEGFAMADTNHNGSISRSELIVAVKAVAAHYHYTPTAADKEWVGATAMKDAGADHKMSEPEFSTFSNAVANHFHLC